MKAKRRVAPREQGVFSCVKQQASVQTRAEILKGGSQMAKRQNPQNENDAGAKNARQEEEGVAIVQEQIGDVYNMGTIDQAELTEEE
ncbi:DUF4025 domain-containing protein [Brevibacillus panacihumi]|uniref:DUF4025 domain-containing protein n=2 Tax=Brevibacillus panacihumi TaxID=497735 RepID=A0A3M8CLF6_9BACL|nr:DUF4025 domain-containing protein [Brevibacillus panacihumi]